MKAEIHPNYHATATVSCACGESYTAGSTKEAVSVELCAACHPFYTGKEKVIDTAGRIDRFKARYGSKEA